MCLQSAGRLRATALSKGREGSDEPVADKRLVGKPQEVVIVTVRQSGVALGTRVPRLPPKSKVFCRNRPIVPATCQRLGVGAREFAQACAKLTALGARS